MELLKNQPKVATALKKYKYAFIILAIGILLMCIPVKQSTQETGFTETDIQSKEQSVNEELAQILSQIEGVGDTKVILSISLGEETVYQTDINENTDENSSKLDSETVIISDSSRGEKGLIRQVIPATYMGAIVVCKGADNPQVRLSVVDAVAKFTGLGANKISVLKMK